MEIIVRMSFNTNSPLKSYQKGIMSKKIVINAFFISLCVLMSVFIFTQKDKIQSDIYALLSLNFSPHQKEAIAKNTTRLNKEFILLSDDIIFLDKFKNLGAQSLLFDNITTHLKEQNFNLNELSKLKIASFGGFDSLIENERFKDEKAFMQELAKRLFSPFFLLPLSEDFLNLSANSTLLKNNNFTLDLTNSVLYTEFEGKKYYLARANLKDKFSHKELVRFVDELQNLAQTNGVEIFLHSGALFESKATLQGEKEGLYMSLCSIFLLGILSLCAFGRLSAFKLIFIIAFSLLGGLCGALLCFESLHLLSLVISTSLVGLILDFSLHYLSFKDCKDKALKQKKLLKTFLISLCITSSAYALFLLSHSLFLEQMAIISIFALLFSFIATYFWLPQLINTSKFSQKACFKATFLHYLHFLRFVGIKKILFVGAFFFVLIALWRNDFDFSDDIRTYSSLDEKALIQSKKVFEISGIFTGSNMLLIKGGLANEKKLIKALMENDLIGDYEGLSKYFLTPAQQQSLKNAINSFFASEEVVIFFENLAFSQKELANFATHYAQMPILSENELLQSPFTSEFKGFLLGGDYQLVVLENPLKNARFYELIKSYEAEFINFNESLNSSFTEIKIRAIYLKLIGFVFAFVILWAFLGYKKAFLFTAFIIASAFLCLMILLAFGVNINIFAIFGLILASAVGIDYCLFAQNQILPKKERILSIMLCALTSIISFALLSFSQTNAISSFGLAVSVNLCLLALVASLYAMKHKENRSF